MRRPKLPTLLLCLAVPFLACAGGCGKSNPVVPPPDDETLVATGTIGPSGGMVGDTTAQVVLPAGALSGSTEIKIYAGTARPFGQGTVTPSYRITGLPATCPRPVHLRLRYQGALSEQSFVALGTVRDVSELGGAATGYGLIAAVDSGGFLVADLDLSAGGAGAPRAPGVRRSSDAMILQASGTTGFRTRATAHFKVIYPVALAATDAPDSIAAYLERAHSRLAALGFSYGDRTEWPVPVILKYDIEKAADGTVPFGYSTRLAPFTANTGFLVLNADHASQRETMLATVGHEWFHLVQDLYTSSQDYAWLHDATAVWFEEKMIGRSGYVSAALKGQEQAPFRGMQAGVSEGAGHHGYGMSAMIRHLVNVAGGEAWIAQVYGDARTGRHPVEALLAHSPDPALISWWSNFFIEYVQGHIYGVDPAGFVDPITVPSSRRFQVQGPADTLKAFDFTAPDLSARLFIVELKYARLDSSAVLSLEVDGSGDAGVTVFSFKGHSVTHRDGYAARTVTIANPRVLTDGGSYLLVLVTNKRHVAPYTDSTPIRLTMRIAVPNVTTGRFTLTSFQQSASVGPIEDGHVTTDILPKMERLLSSAHRRVFDLGLSGTPPRVAAFWTDVDNDGYLDERTTAANEESDPAYNASDIKNAYTATGNLAGGTLTGTAVYVSVGSEKYASLWYTAQLNWSGAHVSGTVVLHSRFYQTDPNNGRQVLRSEGTRTYAFEGMR